MGLFRGIIGKIMSGGISGVDVIDPEGMVKPIHITTRGRTAMENAGLILPLMEKGLKIDAGSIKHCGPRSAEGRN